MKRLLCWVLTILTIVTLCLSVHATYHQKADGSYSTATPVTERSYQWIMEHFGHCETLPQLLSEIDAFGCTNFTYMLWDPILIQEYDLDRFLFEWDYHGLCHDFAGFVKSVVVVWSEAKGRTDVKAYVYNIRTDWTSDGHSYNYIREDGHTWYFCLTTNVTRTANGKPSLRFAAVPNGDIQAELDRYGEFVINID